MPTSNLVSRLETAGSTGCDLSPGDPLCASAAEEIKRLGREVTRLQTDLIGAKEFFASATGTIEKLTAQRNRLHNQLLEHAEVCGESAYPISDRLAGESPASFHARALLALAQTAQMSASARNTLVSIAKAISSPFETNGVTDEQAFTAAAVRALRGHRWCGDQYPENGWPDINTALALYAKLGRSPLEPTAPLPGELEQLRRIDKAAREYVENRTHGNYSKLCDALFSAIPPECTCKPVDTSTLPHLPKMVMANDNCPLHAVNGSRDQEQT